MSTSTDVLVVGAGPTGLTLACDLRRRGVDRTIVDRATTTTPGPAARACNRAASRSSTTSGWPRPPWRPAGPTATSTSRHRYAATAESLCLVRPDGYVAFRSQPATARPVLDHLGSVFSLHAPA